MADSPEGQKPEVRSQKLEIQNPKSEIPNQRKKHFSPEGLAALRANLAKARAKLAAEGPTPRQVSANRANLLKANADKALQYRPTAQRLRASRANLAKARAARRAMPESYARSRYGAMKHGLHVGTLADSLELVGEDPEEFQKHLLRVERAFFPLNDLERTILRHLAEALWRRLRLFRAQARWEADALARCLDAAATAAPLTADEIEDRASQIAEILLEMDRLEKQRFLLLRKVERPLRALLRKRTGANPKFRIFTRAIRRELREMEQMEMETRAYQRLAEGGPEVEAILEKFRPKWIRQRRV
jgi:hypothetical protein